MAVESCPSCGKPLTARAGRTGRRSVYCSAACRQKAYRERQGSDGVSVHGLIKEIGRQVEELVPQPPSVFYSGVTELSSSVARLRRVARTARDTAQESVTHVTVTEVPLDEGDFAALVESHRREIQVHCYRMTGSYDDAEDLVQETFLRAWRARDTFQGRAGARTWLYRIATNACLDFQRRTARRPKRYEPLPGMNHGGGEPPARITWLQPYPDDELPSTEEQPEAAAVSRETLELVFLAAVQHLPPRQRAVLVLRDVLGLTAVETGEALDMTVASVNSALQRARPTLRDRLPGRRADWTADGPTEHQRTLVKRYMAAAERLDLSEVAALLSEDVTLTMPPNPFWFTGRDALLEFLSVSLDADSPMFLGHWRHLPARANGQLAAGGYVRRPGTTVYRAQVLDVLRFGADDRIVEITSFEPHLFPAFGLPLRL
ncbi:sigma-70 family RNA polymerase sigma factor [Streptomyces sp. W16]|uniref:sigma-70 family RNA polymerase sigma factor n=1 Tax=Streptomyces sp. W16 TaxID=3076631 RepID=UPI00295B110C|nr:sigma-70 family RNA polymerase sigma factor [Streptomyces sp. W16]MDV9171610.1 sigma-70 family RNA polymerase sigma factor [Streptomyces sp. W16]